MPGKYLKECYCVTFACRGKEVSIPTFHRHWKCDRDSFDQQMERKPSNPTEVRSTHMNWPNKENDIPLFDGSSETVYFTLAKKLAFFVDHNGITKVALSQMIMEKAGSLPQPNKFPGCYYDAHKLISPYLTPRITYHSCINDCVLFRKYSNDRDLRFAKECDVCRHPRYKSRQVKIPYKRVTYLQLKPQLEKRFGEANIAKLVYAGDVQLEKDPDLLSDIHDGSEWSKWFSIGGVFHGYEEGAVPLAMMTDGLNPNRNMNIKRSMWPVMLSLLTMKGRYRNILGVGLLLVTIIPGWRGSEPKSLQHVLQVIVDELLELVDVQVFNAYRKAPVHIKVSILYTLCDIPASVKVFHTAGQAAIRACPFCEEEGEYIGNLHKCVHTSNRRYLDSYHPLREADNRFPIKEKVIDPAPSQIDPADENMHREHYDMLNVKSHKVQYLKATGFQGAYALQGVPGHERVTQTVTDGMHTPADVLKNIVTLITGKADESVKRHEISIGRLQECPESNPSHTTVPCTKKRKAALNESVGRPLKRARLQQLSEIRAVSKRKPTNSRKCPPTQKKRKPITRRLSEIQAVSKRKPTNSRKCPATQKKQKAITRRKLPNKPKPVSKGRSQRLPPAQWELGKEQKKIADTRAMSIDYPSSSCLKPKPYFSKPCQLVKMDMYMKFATENVLVHCVKGLLGNDQEGTLKLFCSTLCELVKETHMSKDLSELEDKMRTALALLERDFPVSLQNITTHLMQHIVPSIKSFGPLPGRWMFPIERALSWMSRQVLNKHHQESTILETYVIYELVTWLRMTGYLPPAHSATPGFLDLLDGLGHSTVERVPFSKKEGTTVNLKRDEVTEIVKYFNSYNGSELKIQSHQVQPIGKMVSSVTGIRNCHEIMWTTKASDSKKPTMSHNVCWLCSTTPFSKYKKVQNLEDFKAGKITGLIHLKVGDKIMTFARIEQMETKAYDFGGIWMCKTDTTIRAFVNLESLSVPLITAKCGEMTHFLNSKIYHEPSEARAILDLITPK